ILTRLRQHGVELDYKKLARNVLPEYYQKNGRMSEGEAVRGVRDFLLQELRSIPISWQPQHQKKYLCLIGPTGVGKTTTLVKIAAHFVLERKEKISLITIDTYRIGAVEQLKTYGEILNVPVHVCYEKSDFNRALAHSAHCDRVLIDTVGRNYFETEHVKDLLRWFDGYDEMETYFVLSLTMKEDDARKVYEQFTHVPIDGFIFTKFDETRSFGSLYNLPLAFEKPVAYVTTGQEVPDDIVKAKPEWIVQQITGAVRS
ncbi:MAG: AAA family ATPase, partial [Caldibacillus sp.]